eukprot:356703-Chlamydomonas_euryale.AAC.7
MQHAWPPVCIQDATCMAACAHPRCNMHAPIRLLPQWTVHCSHLEPLKHQAFVSKVQPVLDLRAVRLSS